MLYIGMHLSQFKKYKQATSYLKKALEFICDKTNKCIESKPTVHKIYELLAHCLFETGNLSESKKINEVIKKWQECCDGNNSVYLLQT